MSYSRWICSRWYAYSECGTGNVRCHRSVRQSFVLDPENEDIDAFLSRIRKEGVTEEDAEELRGILSENWTDILETKTEYATHGE